MTSKILKNILYVEDESDIAEIAKLALEQIGSLSLKLCSNGKDALELLQSYCPDLIILDVMMPSMDGPTLLSKLRLIPSCANIPVIFMTAKVQKNEIDHYIKLGSIGVISKPFDPMTLTNEVKKLWDDHNG